MGSGRVRPLLLCCAACCSIAACSIFSKHMHAGLHGSKTIASAASAAHLHALQAPHPTAAHATRRGKSPSPHARRTSRSPKSVTGSPSCRSSCRTLPLSVGTTTCRTFRLSSSSLITWWCRSRSRPPLCRRGARGHGGPPQVVGFGRWPLLSIHAVPWQAGGRPVWRTHLGQRERRCVPHGACRRCSSGRRPLLCACCCCPAAHNSVVRCALSECVWSRSHRRLRPEQLRSSPPPGRGTAAPHALAGKWGKAPLKPRAQAWAWLLHGLMTETDQITNGERSSGDRTVSEPKASGHAAMGGGAGARLGAEPLLLCSLRDKTQEQEVPPPSTTSLHRSALHSSSNASTKEHRTSTQPALPLSLCLAHQIHRAISTRHHLPFPRVVHVSTQTPVRRRPRSRQRRRSPAAAASPGALAWARRAFAWRLRPGWRSRP